MPSWSKVISNATQHFLIATGRFIKPEDLMQIFEGKVKYDVYCYMSVVSSVHGRIFCDEFVAQIQHLSHERIHMYVAAFNVF